MIDLNETLIFTKVIENKSFTAAARALDLPKSTISRKINQLEERLGVRLLHRTTRSLKLTDEGSTYYEKCHQIVREIEEAEQTVTQYQQEPKGKLRITAPVEFGTSFISQVLPGFMRMNPQVTFDIDLTGRLVDVVNEGFDIAIRAGKLSDSTLVARKLFTLRRQLYASPDYLSEFGTPLNPQELGQHRCIGLQTSLGSSVWQLHRNGQQVDATINSGIKVNSLSFHRDMAVAGMGIANLPAFLCAEEVKQGRLQIILEDWQLDDSDIYALYPTRKHLSSKVRAFLDYLIEELRNLPQLN
jgi:DNA-binding transcriptional LysR family regulator